MGRPRVTPCLRQLAETSSCLSQSKRIVIAAEHSTLLLLQMRLFSFLLVWSTIISGGWTVSTGDTPPRPTLFHITASTPTTTTTDDPNLTQRHDDFSRWLKNKRLSAGSILQAEEDSSLVDDELWWESLECSNVERWQHHFQSHDDKDEISFSVASQENPLLVQTRFGPILGDFVSPIYQRAPWDRLNRTKTQHWPRAFLGIPVAEPPVGDLRFRSPVPWTRSWTDAFGGNAKALRANRFGPQCLQILANPLKGLSEDCLYINVFTPPIERILEYQEQNRRFPVMLWNFGGAFSFGTSGVGGSNDGNVYNGAYITANKGIPILWIR